MINQTIQSIVKQHSNKYSDGFIKFDLYSKLDKEVLDFLRLNLDLKEEYLQFINCPQCDEELKIKTRDSIRHIHCFNAGCGVKRELNDNEDLAYKITLGGIADFLITLLKIKEDKKKLLSGRLMRLGQKEIFDLNFDIFLLKEKLSSQEILYNCKPTSKKTPSIIIKLTNKNLGIDQSNISDCWFNDLIFYDENLNKFMISYKMLIETISGSFAGLEKTTMQKSLNDKCSKWLEELINKNLIKRGEKNKFKKEANNLFNTSTKAFDKIWRSIAPDDLKKQGRIKELY